MAVASRLRYSSIRTARGLYECGADDASNALSALNKVQFFRVVALFLIFELEIAILVLAMPILTMLDVESVVAITIFIFLIQVCAIIEVRSGAIAWIKHASLSVCFTKIENTTDLISLSPALYAGVFILVLVSVRYVRNTRNLTLLYLTNTGKKNNRDVDEKDVDILPDIYVGPRFQNGRFPENTVTPRTQEPVFPRGFRFVREIPADDWESISALRC